MTRPWVMKQVGDSLKTADVGTLQPRQPVQPLRPRSTAGTATPATSGATAGVSLQREIFAFANAGNLGSTSVGYTTWQFSLLTTVAYFGIHINSNGTAVTNDAGWNVWHSSTASSFINAAHAAGTKVVLGIIYQDTSQTMCTALDSGVQTANTINANLLGADGVNIDYEGINQTCPDGHTQAHKLDAFTQAIRQRVPGYLSIDTYASSAGDGGGFFDMPTLNQYVDSFFVMDYALEYSNAACPGCLGPTSPLGGYSWNDTRSASEYSSHGYGSKTILGFPYYGVKGCVSSTGPNAQITSGSFTDEGAEPYYDIVQDPTDPRITGWSQRYDANDPAGQELWATFYSGYVNCEREMYWDDANSLGHKYDLVNQYGVRGAGIFTLDYGGGASELWNAIANHFSYVPGVPSNLHVCPGDGFAVMNWTPPPPGASPITSNILSASPGTGTATVGAAASEGVVRGLADGTAYSVGVQAQNGYGRGPAATASVTPASTAGIWPGQLHPLTPQRVVDTRTGNGVAAQMIGPGEVRTVAMLNRGGVPSSGVAGVVLNITATDATAPGYIVAYAAGSCQPLASTVNFGPSQTGTNLAFVPLGAGGAVTFASGSSGSVNLVADVFGWVSNSGSVTGGAGQLHAVTPVRILDTRTGSQLSGGPAAGVLQATGQGGVPSHGVSAVVLNVTVTNPAAGGFVSLYPAGTSWPGTSNVNFVAGQTVPNRVVVPVGTNGQVEIATSTQTDVIVDVGGYYTDSTAGVSASGLYTADTPVRVIDTRDGTGGYGPFGPGSRVDFQVTGLPGIPSSGVTAVVVNITATDSSQPSFIAAFPSDTSWPGVSDLNLAPGRTAANLVVVRLSASGQMSILNASGVTNVIVDVVGWYS